MKLFKILIFIGLVAAAYFFWFKDSTPGQAEGIFQAVETAPLTPIVLKSQDGRAVEIVAVHSASPEGLTFSPTPSGPLIGSNTLQKITTAWENIDLRDLRRYRRIYAAYESALKGDLISLQIGPHFYDLSEKVQEARQTAPTLTVTYSDGSTGSYNFSNPNKQSTLNTRVSRWSISDSSKAHAIDNWSRIGKELEVILYRRDVILFSNKLERAIRALDTIASDSSVFNISSAQAIYELIAQQ